MASLKLVYNQYDHFYHICSIDPDDGKVLQDYGYLTQSMDQNPNVNFLLPKALDFQDTSGKTVSVDDYIDSADNDDAIGINAAVVAAGTGGVVNFTFNREYVCKQTVRCNQPHQIWNCNNALLRHYNNFVGATVLIGPYASEVDAAITAGVSLYPFFLANVYSIWNVIVNDLRVWYKNPNISSDYPVTSAQASGWTDEGTPDHDLFGNCGVVMMNNYHCRLNNIEAYGFHKGVLMKGYSDASAFNEIKIREIRDCKFGVYNYSDGKDASNKGFSNNWSLEGPGDIHWIDGCPDASGGYGIYIDHNADDGNITIFPTIKHLGIESQTISAGMPSGTLYPHCLGLETVGLTWEGLNSQPVARPDTPDAQYINLIKPNTPFWIPGGNGQTSSATGDGGTIAVFAQATTYGTKTIQLKQLANLGASIRGRLWGYFYTTDTTVRTFTWKILMGSTVIGVTDGIALQTNGSTNACGFDLDFEITCRSTGSSGTVMTRGSLAIQFNYSAGAAAWPKIDATNVLDEASVPVKAPAGINSAVTIDLESAQALDIRGLVSDISAVIAGQVGFLELIGPHS